MEVYYDDMLILGTAPKVVALPDLVSFAMKIRHRDPLPNPDWLVAPAAMTPGKEAEEDGKKKKKEKEMENTNKNPNRKH